MNATQAIYRVAHKYGIRDPHALAAVAHAESGLNPQSIGDGGTSFGLFQLHQGGALGNMSTSQARQYLNAYKNAEFAARQMVKLGIQHLTGRDAVDAIVRRFERPADPSGEVERAWAWYNGNKAGAPAGMTGPAMPGMTQPATGMDPNKIALLQSLIDQNARIAKVPTLRLPMAPGGGVSDATPMPSQPTVTSPSLASFSGMFPLGKRGKLIGTPNSGTHTLGNWQSDNAVDIGVPIGTPIIAVSDGVIDSRFGSLGKGGRFAGLRLTLDGKGNRYYYAHLSKYAPGIRPGTRVRKGQIIGYSGSANGVAHLHIGVQNGNPVQMFGL